MRRESKREAGKVMNDGERVVKGASTPSLKIQHLDDPCVGTPCFRMGDGHEVC